MDIVMRIISKKIQSEFFQAVQSGKKKFELRKDEDGIQEGDFIILHEWINDEYTGRSVVGRVGFVLRGFEGLEEGYCVFSFHQVSDTRKRQIINAYANPATERDGKWAIVDNSSVPRKLLSEGYREEE